MRLKSLFNKRTKKQITDNTNEERTSWFLILFIKRITDKFKNIANRLKTKLAFFSLNKLGRIIKVQKDILPIKCNKNIVYKLSCKNCDAIYVGQTKRKLNTRITEHKNDINKKTGKHSMITEHNLNKNHEFDWDPEILDREKYYYRRLISETINIKSQKNTLNMQSDTELLQQTYVEILNKI